MTVHVLLFGPESAVLGRGQVEVELGDDRTCRAAMARLGERFPALVPHLRTGRLAVNSEFAAPEREIREGDEVALIGLVSGG